jgi:mono/diheme cytochrome c family protein
MDIKNRGAVPASLAAIIVVVTAGVLFGEVGALRLDTGEHIYKTACVACHGSDGKGTPKSVAGFEPPDSFPDFTRCDQTTAELDNDYRAVIVHGGQYRGFSQIMPSFKQAFTAEQINKVIGYLRHFCREDNPNSWPRGELNLPRAMVTEKAYPEDEEVVSTAVNARGAPGTETHIIHEQRFGKKNQLEVDGPNNFQNESHAW